MGREEEVTKVWDLPCKSQDFNQPPRLAHRGDELDLIYDCDSKNGEFHDAMITFRGVEAFSFTSFESCTIEQVAAYDKVVVLITSSWLKDLHSRRKVDETFARHYRIFFDEVGCYDVIASAFVPVEQGG